MLYPTLFLARFFPFWAVPLALVFFELGVYHYNRRVRNFFLPCFAFAAFLVLSCLVWIFTEGYWRWGPALKRFFEG